jgi:hypothetical protein
MKMLRESPGAISREGTELTRMEGLNEDEK